MQSQRWYWGFLWFIIPLFIIIVSLIVNNYDLAIVALIFLAGLGIILNLTGNIPRLQQKKVRYILISVLLGADIIFGILIFSKIISIQI